MVIDLPKDVERQIKEQVKSGSFSSAGEVIREGLRLLQAREEFRRAVGEGAAQADRGELIEGKQALAQVRKHIRSRRSTRT